MKKIALISHSTSQGPILQRGHNVLKFLRNKYEFRRINVSDVDYADLMYFDAVIVFHSSGKDVSRIVEACRYKLQMPVIVDIDDLLDRLPTDHPHYGNTGPEHVAGILSHASFVVVSTDFLYHEYRKHNQNTIIIRNAIDQDRYSTALNGTFAKQGHSGFVVGWTGSQTHQPDLAFTGFTEGLDQFMYKYDDAKASFHLLCPQKLYDKYGARIMFNQHAVHYLDYPSLCASFPWDVCAVPLAINDFNHAKSDLRLIDMAPFDIPVIASHVRDFTQHKHREVCLYADNTPNGWFMALEYAYLNRDVLTKIAKNAKNYVISHRLATLQASQWDRLLGAILQKDPSSQACYPLVYENVTQAQHHGTTLKLIRTSEEIQEKQDSQISLDPSA